jgi:hypothetical protein
VMAGLAGAGSGGMLAAYRGASPRGSGGVAASPITSLKLAALAALGPPLRCAPWSRRRPQGRRLRVGVQLSSRPVGRQYAQGDLHWQCL